MDKILREFYGQDASLGKLSKAEQQMKFLTWAESNGYRKRLEFGTGFWIRYIRIGGIVTAAIYLVSFIPGAPEIFKAAFPFAVILMLISIARAGRRPILIDGQNTY